MLERLMDFLRRISEAGGETGVGFANDDPRLAAATLMFRVIEADGVLRAEERMRFAEVLKDQYGLDEEGLDALAHEAEKADSAAVDLYQFTSVLNRLLDEAGKIEFIEILWEMVYADGRLHELEDNVVWRVAELLGVSTRDRVLMRQRVRERVIGDPGDAEE